MLIKANISLEEKLSILSNDSKYDLACACAPSKEEHRKRSKEDKWIYPVVFPNGGKTFLFKTLLSNECINNCKYCPLRINADTKRLRLEPEELVRLFLSYYKSGKVSGLFLSSGVINNPDVTMERINHAAVLLRRQNFRGYIHLKIIPGASDAAIRKTIALASAVSLNIETAGEVNFKELSTTKNYLRDIINPTNLISRLTQRGSFYQNVKHTTQFVVGASKETDKEIVGYSWKLYREFNLDRVYFSSYQRGAGAQDCFGERSSYTNNQLLTREHRLYQADWLLRKYGFQACEIPFCPDGNLSLETDPKEMWARRHPESFPININKADRLSLLRIPGIGIVLAERILAFRKNRVKLSSLSDLGKVNKNLRKALSYIAF
ncbi:MAG: helix-hairpin-helix domain-containing protein [Candidatus Omnitrophica bacterium]|jgi:predicted DNA-binding helix-hairpin-helix protein|nr:helix-hairpin-helix domain-containing protein [Candidatus Omnitrophota bacterium]